MKVLISAGPTQEPIDSVRFITNASSGRMGLALARAAVKQGHKVTVVLGPVAAKPRVRGVRFVNVRTAAEMADAVLKELDSGFDVFISAAAVGDYTPDRTFRKKLDSGRSIVLRLKPTGKITALAKRKFPKVFVVAFKAEFNVSKDELVGKAFSKLSKENLDLIVANDIGRNRMGSVKTKVHVIDKLGCVTHVKAGRKSAVAGKIMKLVSSAIARTMPKPI